MTTVWLLKERDMAVVYKADAGALTVKYLDPYLDM
jgi:hypothetical protein